MALPQAILALLVDRPQSGYDLTKNFEKSVGCFWKATHQQIYRDLAKLEAQGWVQAEAVPQEGRPDKKLYTITALGKQHLTDWIAEPCDTTAVKEALLIKVFVGAMVPSHVIQRQLEQHRQLHQAKLAGYHQTEATFFQNPETLPAKARLQYLVLRNGIRYETYWIDWCEEAIAYLQTVSGQN
ncbi:MAG: PadR family transcriptional regulator [Tildeniella nuda ZEHNDER 1965/U140]|jgi:DNA-binding PadR family transcriptional regulator|nr:PadR family transcriptional regulator [Tildeniella nuda ZEHNDER 1965/U140]